MRRNFATPYNGATHMEWKKEETADEAPEITPADWVTPTKGTVIEGVLMRAFVMKDDLNPGKFRAGYVVQDEHGHDWTFGEKAAFKKAIRALPLGTTIRVTYGEKERMKDADGKPTAKTIWRIQLHTADVGVGENVLDVLKKSRKELTENGGDLDF
jgi:hypothetical protein